ncbi:PepSY domain-containing protein [Colwellia sp. M166]|nr:PepSY domain-containing protein [Colwellia sp. M166]
MIVKAKYAQTNNTKSLSPQQAARIVKNKFGGKVLKVSNSGAKNNPSYRVKLLKDNGHVISVNVDAKSGRISGY